jgi:hypothetical protein
VNEPLFIKKRAVMAMVKRRKRRMSRTKNIFADGEEARECVGLLGEEGGESTCAHGAFEPAPCEVGDAFSN